jgi:hypothetical protein
MVRYFGKPLGTRGLHWAHCDSAVPPTGKRQKQKVQSVRLTPHKVGVSREINFFIIKLKAKR